MREQDLESPLFWSTEARDQLMARLAFHGCKKIVVHFSGSNDSGQIDDVEFVGVDESHLDTLKQDAIDWLEVSKVHYPKARQWVEKRTVVPMLLPVIIERLCGEASDRAGIDWWNNEGGQGQFTIDLQDLKNGQPLVHYFVSENFTKTNDYEYDFSDGRERADPVIVRNE